MKRRRYQVNELFEQRVAAVGILIMQKKVGYGILSSTVDILAFVMSLP